MESIMQNTIKHSTIFIVLNAIFKLFVINEKLVINNIHIPEPMYLLKIITNAANIDNAPNKLNIKLNKI